MDGMKPHPSMRIRPGWVVSVVAGINRTQDFRDYRQLVVNALVIRVHKELYALDPKTS